MTIILSLFIPFLLRFSAHDADAMKEQKPSVRISHDAIYDLSKSWIISKYGLVINGK